jgi:BlaI family penicillinase repressor
MPSISDAEWKVMEVLWAAAAAAATPAAAPLTANDVVDALADTGWSPATIKTMLNRLARKRAVKHKADGKRYLYTAAVARDACVRSEGRSFLDRVFGGATGALLAHFVEDARLSREEVEQLRRMLDQKKGRP